jgi:hypothetical protein
MCRTHFEKAPKPEVTTVTRRPCHGVDHGISYT